MIATCPSCSARYKVDDSKIKGRGAKINCPRCSHRFVVYKDDDQMPAPERQRPDVAHLDFSTLGITWRVRKGEEIGYEFFDLATLRDFLHSGQIDRWDSISYDNAEWTPIEAIDDLEEWFYDVWERARRGEIIIAPPDDYDDEDDADAPTTIVGRGSPLASELRQAISQAATSPPPTQRAFSPGPRPASAPQAPAPPPAQPEPFAAAQPPPAPIPAEAPAAPITENEPVPAPLGPSPSLATRSPAPRPAAAMASAEPELDEPEERKQEIPVAALAVAAGAVILVLGAGVALALGLLDAEPAASSPEPAAALVEVAGEPPTDASDAETTESATDGG